MLDGKKSKVEQNQPEEKTRIVIHLKCFNLLHFFVSLTTRFLNPLTNLNRSFNSMQKLFNGQEELINATAFISDAKVWKGLEFRDKLVAVSYENERTVEFEGAVYFKVRKSFTRTVEI